MKGKDVFLLLGPTGAGKSTTLHYLAGSKMKKVPLQTKHGELEDHITTDGLSERAVNSSELKDVKISGYMVSCTRFIKAITFLDEDNIEMTIADSPGLEDNRGPEMDIANIYGVVLAA